MVVLCAIVLNPRAARRRKAQAQLQAAATNGESGVLDTSVAEMHTVHGGAVAAAHGHPNAHAV